MRSVHLALTLGLLSIAAVAEAQVVVLPMDATGEISGDDRAAFRARLLDSATAGGTAEAVTPAEDALDGLSCDGGACAPELGNRLVGSVALSASVHAEAEIYDFRVVLVDMTSGEVVATQTGDCTFCPVAEALDSFGFVVEAAVSGAQPLPAPSAGPARPEPVAAVEPEPEPVAAVEPEPEPVAAVEPEPEPVAAVEPEPAPPAFEPGDIALSVAPVPATASVSVNGAALGAGTASLMVAPQTLTIRVTAAGFRDYVEYVELVESMHGPIFMRVALSAIPAAADHARAGGSAAGQRSVGGILVGTGALAVAGGIAMLALDGESTCSSGPLEACRELYEFSAGGTAAAISGGALLGTGIGLLIKSVRGDETEGTAFAAPRSVDLRNARLR